MPNAHRLSHARKHLSNPRILAQLEEMVRKFVKPQHVEDCVQRVCVAALAAANPPEEEPKFVAFLRGIMEKDVPRYMGQLAREPVMEPQHAEETVEARPAFQDEQMAAAARAAEAKDAKQEQTKQWLAEIAEGKSVQDISVRDGIPTDTIWKRLHRARKWIGALVALLAVIGGGWAIWGRDDAPSIVADHEQESPQQRAAHELRERAHGYCEARDWAACEQLLDSSQRMDPAGEDMPWVKEMRHQIADGRALDHAQPAPTTPDKPVTPSKPPKP